MGKSLERYEPFSNPVLVVRLNVITAIVSQLLCVGMLLKESTRLASLYEVYYFTQFTASQIIVMQRYCLSHLSLIPLSL